MHRDKWFLNDPFQVLTPDLKGPRLDLETTLVWVRPANKRNARLGGSVVAHVYGGLGSQTPDIIPEDTKIFKNAFEKIQTLLLGEQLYYMCKYHWN